MEYVAKNGTRWIVTEIKQSKAFDWEFFAEDFDGAIDSKDDRWGFAPTKEKAIESIENFSLGL